MHEIADLVTDALLPIEQCIDIRIDSRIDGVSHTSRRPDAALMNPRSHRKIPTGSLRSARTNGASGDWS
jgi:hypothetical protein